MRPAHLLLSCGRLWCEATSDFRRAEVRVDPLLLQLEASEASPRRRWSRNGWDKPGDQVLAVFIFFVESSLLAADWGLICPCLF